MDFIIREKSLFVWSGVFRKLTLVIALISLVYLTYLAFSDEGSSQLIHNAAWSVTYLFIPAALISVSLRPIISRAFAHIRYCRTITPLTGLACASPALLMNTDLPGDILSIALYAGSVLFILSEAMIMHARERREDAAEIDYMPDTSGDNLRPAPFPGPIAQHRSPGKYLH